MSDITDYYENYKKIHGDFGYAMARSGLLDRVQYIADFIGRNVPKGGKILDIGCGDMFLSTLMPEYDWVGIDLLINPGLEGKAYKQDLMKPPYDSIIKGPYDAIVCTEVLEHVWDLRIVHKEAKRLLKPGGTYIISTPNIDNIDYTLNNYRQIVFDPKWPHLFEHIRFYNYEAHTKFLEEAGFTVMEHVGCDTQYVEFFSQARQVLLNILNTNFKLDLSPLLVNMIIGQMFSKVNHTILLVSKA